MTRTPRLSFGMIVFNGDAFLRQVLDGVYDLAHEIIVIEGPDEISRPLAGPDGGSADQTVEVLRDYPDPKGKLRVVRGTWRDKDHQQSTILPLVTGDVLWSLDSDEMYRPDDVEHVARAFADDPELMAVEVRAHLFFGGLDRVAVGRHWHNTYWRVHRLVGGCSYLSHRPVELRHPSGRGMNGMGHLSADAMDDRGVRMFHYSYVLDGQVREKMRYHQHWRPTRYPKETDAAKYFHYDYLERIWTPWLYGDAAARDRIEREHGISPQVYRDAAGDVIRDGTAPFVGRHPPAMRSHPLYQQTYGRIAA